MTMQSLARRITPLLLMLALLIVGCHDDEMAVEPTPLGKATVTGVISDENELIVPYAIVEALNGAGARLAIDTTDESGAFTLNALPDDISGVTMRVSREDFKTYTIGMSEAAARAGGSGGMLLRILHEDSCCARLVVNVTGGTSGTALSGVEVRLRRGDRLVTIATTDASGRAVFGNVCRGEFNVRLARSGYRVLERGDIMIQGCDTTSLSLAMTEGSTGGTGDTCCGGILRIVPRDSSDGSVITGASVRITRNGASRTETSGGDGVLFREICPGQYGVRIARDGTPGYRVIEFSITVGCNDTVTITRRMLRNATGGSDSCCNGRLTVVARDSATNALLNGAGVALWKDGARQATRNVENGSAVFTGLCSGRYSIDITNSGYRHLELAVEIGCNGSVEVSRRLLREGGSDDSCCHGNLVIPVRDSATGNALNGATVTLWRGSTQMGARTTENGRVVFTGLCPGTYSFSIHRDGYTSRETGNITLGCNDTLERGLKLLTADTCRTAVLRMRVKDSTAAEGVWLTGVTVTVTRGTTTVATGTTGAEGWYVAEGLQGSSAYTVTFSKDGYRSKSFTFTFQGCSTIQETIRIVHE